MSNTRSFSASGGDDASRNVNSNYIEDNRIYFEIEGAEGGDGAPGNSETEQVSSGGSGGAGGAEEGWVEVDPKSLDAIEMATGQTGSNGNQTNFGATNPAPGGDGGNNPNWTEGSNGRDGSSGSGFQGPGSGGGGGAATIINFIGDGAIAATGGGGGGGGSGYSAFGTAGAGGAGGDSGWINDINSSRSSGGSGGAPEANDGSDAPNGNVALSNISNHNFQGLYGGGTGRAWVEWTELEAPDYNPYTINVSPDPVVVGEEITVDYITANQGEAEEQYDVELYVNGNLEATNTHGGNALADSFTYTTTEQDEGENTTIEVKTVHDAGSRTNSTTINVQTQPNFAVNVEDINTAVDQGDDVVIDYTVTNTGDVSGTKDVHLTRNGSIEQTVADQTIDSGATHEASFSYTTVFDDVENGLTLGVETPDDSQEYDINVLSTTFAEGYVSLNDSPVEGASVRLIDSDSDDYIGVRTTDADGFYSFDPAPDSEYHMIVEYEENGTLYRAANRPFVGATENSTTYSPPIRNEVNFSLEPYSPTGQDSVDFSLINLINAQAHPMTGMTSTTPTFSALSINADSYTKTSLVGYGPGISGTQHQPKRYTETTLSPLSPVLYTDFWVLDGEIDLREVMSYTETYEGFSFTIRARKDYVRDELRHLEEYAGSNKVSKEATGSGEFKYLDQAGGNNTYTLQPPAARREAYQPEFNVLVTSYSETSVSRDEYEVSLEVVREETRDISNINYGSSTRGADEWKFSFNSQNEFTYSGVSWDINADGDDKVLRLPAASERAKNILTDFAAAQDGVSSDNVPQGEDKTEDNTPTSRNTVYVVPADGVGASDFQEGTYIVKDWQVVPAGPTRYTLEVTLS